MNDFSTEETTGADDGTTDAPDYGDGYYDEYAQDAQGASATLLPPQHKQDDIVADDTDEEVSALDVRVEQTPTLTPEPAPAPAGSHGRQRRAAAACSSQPNGHFSCQIDLAATDRVVSVQGVANGAEVRVDIDVLAYRAIFAADANGMLSLNDFVIPVPEITSPSTRVCVCVTVSD
jgi:hypothetical protein